MADDIDTESADSGTMCALFLDAGLHKDGEPLLTQAFVGKVPLGMIIDVINTLQVNEVH